MAKLDRKNWFLPPTLNRSSSVEHGLAKLLTFYFTARGRPLSKPHGPWPAGFGDPWNPKSLNLTYFRPSSFTLLDRSVLSLPFIIRLYRPVFVPWIVHFQISRPSTFCVLDRSVWYMTIQFQSFGPFSLIHDRPVSVVWNVHFHPR